MDGNKNYLQSVVYFKPDGLPEDRGMNSEFTVIGFDSEQRTTKAWHFTYTNQGRIEAEVQNNRLVIQLQEGKPGEANFRKQTKTFELVDAKTLVVTDSEEPATARTPPVRLKKSE